MFSRDQRNASSISFVEVRVEKIDEYDFAWTLSMKAMFVSTASSCGVTASGMSEIAPTVPWIVSSRVSPVKTRIVSVFSSSVSVAHEGTSLLSGTFSGDQKLPVRRSQTSSSTGSTTRFQLMASTCEARVRFSTEVFSLLSSSVQRGVSGRSASQHARDATVDLGALRPRADAGGCSRSS